MLNRQEIYEIQRSGIDFGSYALLHPDLTRLPLELLEMEISCWREIFLDNRLFFVRQWE